MRIECKTTGIYIFPEDEQDKAYINDTLKLREDKDYINLCLFKPVIMPESMCLHTREGDR